jgi:hypothetical protein
MPHRPRCSGYDPAPLSRRELLAQGLGGVALSWLLAQEASASDSPRRPNALSPHFVPKAKRVIQIFCTGGVSHVDTFDYKPELDRNNGKPLTGKGKIDTFFGQPGNLMATRFPFRQRGESGLWMSDLLPHLAGCADDLTFVYSVTAKTSNHTPATFQMNSGFTMNGFPCLGAWLSYGLGCESRDLPAFVVLPDPRGVPAGGAINWTQGFLPASHQGVAFGTGPDPIRDLTTPKEVSASARGAGFRLLGAMNREFQEANPGDSTLSARIHAYELAARMQASVPDAIDFQSEPEWLRRMYGLDSPETLGFGRNCLLARRLLERGVRFVQLYNGGAFGTPRINWDGHEDLVDNHTRQAAVMDQPVAALLKDLKQRGMLEDTLVLWTTEFGRTPITQGLNARGRDHHQHVFTCWMAGAGLKPGFGYGASDEVGYYPAEKPVQIYDLHATVLHLLGLDHKRLTYYHNGIQRRLTDVHGEVIHGILA